MRGKQTIESALNDAIGITPADAGKTSTAIVKVPRGWDHPRGCGENFDVLIIHPKQVGSPPRMRGKPDGRRVSYAKYRITPADAGKTV